MATQEGMHYYTPNILEQSSPVLQTAERVQEDLILPKPYERLYNQLLIDFSQRMPDTNRPLTVETGLEEFSPEDKKVKPHLRESLRQLIALKTQDIDPYSPEGERMRTVTRSFVSAFTGVQSEADVKHGLVMQPTYVKSLQEESYLGFVALSLEFAKHPELLSQLTLQTGLGGSNDKTINLRLPAQAVPPIHTYENIKAVCGKYQLDVKQLPTIRLFFAYNPAVVINGTKMEKEDVEANAKRNMQYMQRYVHEFHEEAEQDTVFEMDTPWDQHDEITEVTLEHASDLLKMAYAVNGRNGIRRKNLDSAIEKLQHLGRNHGGLQGEQLAYLYASDHPLLFKELQQHPKLNIFPVYDKTLFTISYGGRPERLFNVTRAAIRSYATIDSLHSYSLRSGHGALARNLGTFKEELMDTRSVYGTSLADTSLHYGDMPAASVMALTTIGAEPVYYTNYYDIAVETVGDVPTQVLAAKEQEILTNFSGQERNLQNDKLSVVRHDLAVLTHDIAVQRPGKDSEIELVNFATGRNLS